MCWPAVPDYPLRGTLELRDAAGHSRNGHAPATGEVYLDHRALVALDIRWASACSSAAAS